VPNALRLSAEWQVWWRCFQGLQTSDAILHQERHSKAPGDVHIEMAVHEPHPLVVGGDEPDDSPAVDGHGDRVPHGRIVEVERGSVGCCVEVAEALGEDVVVVAVDVDGVVLGGEDVGALEHDGAVLELRHRLPERAAHVLRRVVEPHRRVGREVVWRMEEADGSTKETLLMLAVNRVLLGPPQFWPLLQLKSPTPTVKKRSSSTREGSSALRRLVVAVAVSLYAGRVGMAGLLLLLEPP
jgi:hypothetical protein